jgi:hypothetical protein
VIWESKYLNHRNEWHSGDYIIVQDSDNTLRCYFKKNFIGDRVTIELAKEFCEVREGKE